MKKDIYNASLGCIIVFTLLLPYLINWDNSYITIHDYLDGVFIFPEIIQQNHAIWDFDATIPFMHGISRDAFPMTYPWEIKPLINYLFPGYGGVYINILLVKLIAFLGMWLLLDRYVSKNKWISFVVSIIYAMIPFYVDFGLSSAGIPLLCFAILNLKNKRKVINNMILVAFFGLFSSFPLSGFFVCVILFFYLVSLWYEEKHINYYLLLSLVLLSTIYIVCNWSLMADFFFGADFVSHRKEWLLDTSMVSLISEFVNDVFIVSPYHAGALYVTPLILIFLIVYYKYSKENRVLKNLLGIFVVMAILIMLGKFAVILPFEIFTSFQFDRFYFFLPSLCFIMLAKAAEIVCSHQKKLAYLVITISVLCVIANSKEYIVNSAKLVGVELSKEPSFKAYYDTSLFTQIHKDLNIPNDYSIKVVSLGMFPAIASYNGFWSLDGYMGSYSLEYKHKFRRIIGNELDKNCVMQRYFDNWGSRCYIFSSEIYGKGITHKNNRLKNLEIDTIVLKELGCQYIFSAVEINNYNELGLLYVNSYTTPESYRNIRVYKLI